MTSNEPGGQRTDWRTVGGDGIARWFLVAVACGLVWRLVRFGLHFELTGDETGIMLSVMERGYAGLLHPLSYYNVSPPLFLWMTKVLDSISPNEWAVRLMPFLAGIGAMAMFGLICREAFAGMARWVSWAFFCVAYVPIAESTRVKGYTIDLLAATVMLWLMLRWLHTHKARYLLWLALCAPVFVWLSFTSVFIIGAVGLAFTACLLKLRPVPKGTLDDSCGLGWRNISAGLTFMALAAVSTAFLYVLNIRPGLQASLGNGLQDAWKRGFPPSQVWEIPMWLLSVHTGRGFAWPVGENHYGSTLTCVLWLVGLIAFWRHGNRRVWILFFAPQVLALAAAFLHKYPYLQNPRICMFLGPGICLFAGCGAQYLIERVDSGKRRFWYCFAACALALCALAGMGRDIALRLREVRGPGIRSTLAEISRLLGADGQIVVLNDAKNSGVFTYYIQRIVKQKVWYDGQIPKGRARDSRLALVAVASKLAGADGASLFGEFERRYGRPLKVEWIQTAHEVLLDSKDSILVWICE
ncbi:MAG: hypothetical protein ACLQU4_13780 [Limisphaerales bacterium]